MKVRCLSEPFHRLYGDRVFLARLAEDEVYSRVLPSMGRQVLEIDADGAPVQLAPPFSVEVVDATPEELTQLEEAGYEVHDASPDRTGDRFD
jgi:hypothetical protein